MPTGSTGPLHTDRLRQPGRTLLDRLREHLRQGDWPVGTRLPPTRRLAEQHGVSRATVQSVLSMLSSEGWIRCDGRSGVYVQRSGQAGPDIPIPRRRRAIPPRDHAGLMNFELESRPLSGEGPRWSDEVLAGAHEELAARHLNAAIFSPLQPDEDTQRQFMARLAQAADHVIGVLALQPYLVESTRQQIEALGLPCVVVHRRSPAEVHNFVAADHWAGGQTIGQLLACSEVERIIYLGGDGSRNPDKLRFCSDRELVEGLLSGYLQARGSLPPSFTLLSADGTSQEHGRAAIAQQLTRAQPPQVVVAAGDFLAVGAIRACLDAGLRVPQDVGVIGSTGLWVAEQSDPTLSTLAQPMRQIGAVGARMLLRLAQSGRRQVSGRVLPSRLILRQSWQPDPRIIAHRAQHLPARVVIDRHVKG